MPEKKSIKIQKTKRKESKIDFFERMPFNYCDRWCERCNYKNKCRIYQEEFASRFKHIAKGEDPDDPEIFFKDIKEGFEKVAKVLEKDFKKTKIDSKKVKKGMKREIIMEKKIESKVINSSLYKEAHIFTLKTSSFLKRIFFEYESSAEDFIDLERSIEELNWYHTFFLVKLHRGLISQMRVELVKGKKKKEIDLKDIGCSAKLSYASLFVCHRSLKKFSQECLGFTKWAKDLRILSNSLLEKIETKFPNMSQVKIIFHA